MTCKIKVLAAKLVFIAIINLSITSAVYSQNGKLVNVSPVTFTKQQIERMQKYDPSIRDILAKVEIKSITYLSDGLKVKGYLAYPKDGKNLPCVIFNRGGNREFGALSDRYAAYSLARIADWGYVVVASQYRGNAGGEGREEFGGADINDVLNLIPLLESLPQADASRIGMYGRSRGGMMMYIALTKTDRIAAAISGAGSTDAFDTIKRRPEMEQYVYSELVPDYTKNKEVALTTRSAVRWPEKLHKKTPILLLHGSADWRVHPSQALNMASSLYEAKHPFRLVFFEGGDHRLTEHRSEVNRLVKDWLNRYVRDKQDFPSLEPHGR